jgi:hypothetical protein
MWSSVRVLIEWAYARGSSGGCCLLLRDKANLVNTDHIARWVVSNVCLKRHLGRYDVRDFYDRILVHRGGQRYAIIAVCGPL